LDLPLLSRANENTELARAIVAGPISVPLSALCGVGSATKLPPVPAHGEQYRFHFDMAKCIGCKCCVVACNEQNGNPAGILWRRVGEIEGGAFPNTMRSYLSMGCNHCLEPTCLTGCPVDAYTKDSLTGIVRHSADACIGCQYCTWNCSYGVPQYNPERGVVGKCDMCYGRLEMGESPACVSACPEGAIRIETVNIAAWRDNYREHANAPGMPLADDSLSTTRITLPQAMPHDIGKVTLDRLEPESPHWPLIVMTVLTQLAAGAFTTIAVSEWLGVARHRNAALVALSAAFVALASSTLHLGRPIHAIRALRMWRRSWLSREVLLFSLFAGCASLYSASLWFQLASSLYLGAATVLLGFAGVCTSARLYLAPGRPAWNSPFTFAEFLCTAMLLGSFGAVVLTRGATQAWVSTALALLASFVTLLFKIVWLTRSDRHELRGSGQLLMARFGNHLLLRWLLPVVGLLIALHPSVIATIISAAFIIGSEFLARYLFFVSVVPSNMAAQYLVAEVA
jgi:DMSO reductase iron-sulfur subunit